MTWARVKKEPYAFYDLCPWPMAWAQVIIQKKNPTQIMTRIDNLLYQESKENEIENSFVKLTICLFLLFLCFIFALSWKFWPQLDSKYASFSNIISV